MAYMESKRYLHRDIAARNILIGSPECVKLSDFGKAVCLGNNSFYQGIFLLLFILYIVIILNFYRLFTYKNIYLY